VRWFPAADWAKSVGARKGPITNRETTARKRFIVRASESNSTSRGGESHL
jgi:hypothetical protein